MREEGEGAGEVIRGGAHDPVEPHFYRFVHVIHQVGR